MEYGTRNPAKVKRNLKIASDVINGLSLKDAAKKYGIKAPTIEQMLQVLFRKKLLPEEERLRYLSAKNAAKEYHDRLEQKILREEATK